MKVLRYDEILGLNTNNQGILNELRRFYAFDVNVYLEYKMHLIKEFFTKNDRNSVVLGISGGIDSALALFLLDRVSKEIELHIHPVFIGMGTGVTHQSQALEDAQKITGSLNRKLSIINLSDEQLLIESNIQNSLNMSPSIWSSGQFASCLRSPVYYYIASLLTDNGERPVVCGTINRSEGAYLGYWGKTSDASVDIQILADLLKSEVVELARFLRVPEEIINRTPKGDVYDASSDEELFGVSYDALELFILAKCHPEVLQAFKLVLNDFDTIESRIESMHAYNKHKYQTPSKGVWGVHLNVMDAGCPGGWPTVHVEDGYPTMIHGEFQ